MVEKYKSDDGHYYKSKNAATHADMLHQSAEFGGKIFLIPAAIGIGIMALGMFLKRHFAYFITAGICFAFLFLLSFFVTRSSLPKILKNIIITVAGVLGTFAVLIIPSIYYADKPDPVYVTSERTIMEGIVYHVPDDVGKQLATVEARELVYLEGVTRNRMFFKVTTADGVSGWLTTAVFPDDVIPHTSILHGGSSKGGEFRQKGEITAALAGRTITVISSVPVYDNENIVGRIPVLTLKEGDVFVIAGNALQARWDDDRISIPIRSGNTSGWALAERIFEQFTPEMIETAQVIVDERNMIGRKATIITDNAVIKTRGSYSSEWEIERGKTVTIMSNLNDDGTYSVRWYNGDNVHNGYLERQHLRIEGVQQYSSQQTQTTAVTQTQSVATPAPAASTQAQPAQTTAPAQPAAAPVADVPASRAQRVNSSATNSIDAYNQRGMIDQEFQYLVTGTTSNGTVWGTGPYLDTSNIAMAAVHAGKLQVGETGWVTVKITARESSYASGTANGVTTTAQAHPGSSASSFIFVD